METEEIVKEQKSASRRYITIFLILVVVGIFVIIKMGVVMFAERQYWHEVSRNSVEWNKTIPPRRGNILSDEGLLMASSMPQYRIYFDYRTSERNEKRREEDQYKKDTLFANYLNEFAAGIHELFPQYSQAHLASYYRAGKNNGSHYYALLPNGKPLSYNQFKAVKQLMWLKPKYEGWFYSYEEKISRKKPFGSLATRTLGDLFGAKDAARYGLELSYDSILRGKPGIGHQEKIQNISRVVADKPQIDGCDIVTTINVDIQDIAENALIKQMESMSNSLSGIAVVMEVETGDIKAMTSLTRTDDDRFLEVQNNAITDLYEPGSTFKTVSMMIALDDGKFSLDDSIDANHGSFRFFGSEMTDHNKKDGGYGVLTVPEVLMFSSNIGTSRLIYNHYTTSEEQKKFVDRVIQLMGIHYDMGMVGTAVPKINPRPNDKTFVPWLSIGYNSQLPIINTLAFYNAIANNGKMVAPRLVKRVQKDGKVIKEYPTKVVINKICSDGTLKDIQYMLELVVSDGLAKQAGSKHFKVAGKTGTAQVSKGTTGYKSGRTNYLLSFCGYFPADKPQYTCFVSLRTEGGVASGGGYAGPIFHEISQKIMASNNMRDISEAVDTVGEKLPRVLSGDLSKSNFVLKELGIKSEWKNKDKVRKDSVWGTASRDSGDLVMTARNYRNNMIPNVVGMGASDALYLLESIGLEVSMSGVGRVSSQSLQPGSLFSRGNRITITLRM